MISVPLAYLVFAIAGLAAFRIWRPAVAALAVFLGGWVLLPVGVFPAGAADVVFPYWITGLAVPSEMLLTKSWVAPGVALLGSLVFDWRTLRQLRPTAFDAPVALWCGWPLVQAALSSQADPAPLLSSLYLAGSWGAPWLLGRIYCSNADGQQLLMRGMTWSALACLPFSLFESVAGPGGLYGLLFGPHPFRADGAERYLGFRPLGFFENGNQYGLWVALCAIAAVWLARSGTGARRRNDSVAAGLVVLMALAAQSVGAILLMGLGIGLLCACEFINLKRMFVPALALFVLSGAVYFSGVVPVRQLASETSLGRAAVDAIKGVGRGSLTWRISQDQKLLRPALIRPLSGSAQWDWWRPEGVRPWGLPLLVTGQFGLVGLALCFGLLLAPTLRAGLHGEHRKVWRRRSVPIVLAVIIMLAVSDALLNSFIFFPAVLAAGGLGSARRAGTADDGSLITRVPVRRSA